MSKRLGRPQKPYAPSYGGDPVPGLYHCPDGRWRINATGERYTESDERRAVQRYLDWRTKNQPATSVTIEGDFRPDIPPAVTQHTVQVTPEYAEQAGKKSRTHGPKTKRFTAGEIKGTIPISQEAAALLSANKLLAVGVGYTLPESVLWPWLAKMLTERPEYVAKMTGVLEVAGLRHLPLPRASIRITRVQQLYSDRTDINPQSKNQALKCFARLVKHCGAKTLDDLTTEKLISFRTEIESLKSSLTTEQSRRFLYSNAKAVLAYPMKQGEDAQPIRAALDRCKVLFTSLHDDGKNDPNPISPSDFRSLLRAGNGSWRPWLLMGLNCCMYLADLCGLKWDSIDLEAGTLVTRRNKKGQCVRAAMLWPETIEALKGLRKGPTYLFNSSHGTGYDSAGRYNQFNDLRRAAGLPDDVKFSHIRDGAYTVGSEGTTDERRVRVLAGHKAPGLQDRYVLRNPQITAEPCEAIRQKYGPF